MSEFSSDWLYLREPADAAARAGRLLEPLREFLPADFTVRDLGCGTGSLGRWLAARLPGTQHWILHDHDTALLDHARAALPAAALDGSPVDVVAEQRDVTALRAADLAGTSLVTASALLDLLTRDEVTALAKAVVEAGCAALLMLSVTGRVELSPADPLDPAIAAAFNAHQRRIAGGRRLLGPNAVDVAATAFDRLGATVRRAESAWRLGPDQAELQRQWLEGWVGAAVEQLPELRPVADVYLQRRLEMAQAGELRAVIHHGDLLVLPPSLEVAA
ncbi:Methyltransferase domain-containing protein [Amycolatopsis pretoriensis]|uniref:Methyltransferase domain-containing protein n=1 Tax=Amycolatopsis pretoriensis TaxID=218821 RepID=A0A1H5RGJ8_9PSEU|nr:methyltransferase domain-containing protein [Amycolatopsis pretoriensis]SEF36838.1 Methyltransferase domain-containing protein [Amycolatopsis pretoriensis]